MPTFRSLGTYADGTPGSADRLLFETSSGLPRGIAPGTGSGLDADLLDGQHASAFATAAQGALADMALQPAQVAVGMLTPAPAALNLGGGVDGQVLTKQADGSWQPEDVPSATAGAYVPASSSISTLVGTFLDGVYPATAKGFGAIADGSFHALSERYASVGAAQAAYPNISALITNIATQSLDWAACQAAVSWAGGHRLAWFEDGHYILGAVNDVAVQHIDMGWNTNDPWYVTCAPRRCWVHGAPGKDVLYFNVSGSGELHGCYIGPLNLVVDQSVDPNFERSSIEGLRILNAGIAVVDPARTFRWFGELTLDQVVVTSNTSGNTYGACGLYAENTLYALRVRGGFVSNSVSNRARPGGAGFVNTRPAPKRISAIATGTETFTTTSAHGFIVGDTVFLTTMGTMPAGTIKRQNYTVATTPTTSSFTLTGVNVSSAGSGDVFVFGQPGDLSGFGSDTWCIDHLETGVNDQGGVGVSIYGLSQSYIGSIIGYGGFRALEILHSGGNSNVIAKIWIEQNSAGNAGINTLIEAHESRFGPELLLTPNQSTVNGCSIEIRGNYNTFDYITMRPVSGGDSSPTLRIVGNHNRVERLKANSFILDDQGVGNFVRFYDDNEEPGVDLVASHAYTELSGTQSLTALAAPANSTIANTGGAATWTLPSRLASTALMASAVRLTVHNAGSGTITFSASGPTLVGASTVAAGASVVIEWCRLGTGTERVFVR